VKQYDVLDGSAELLDAGVDWLTLSWPGLSAERAPRFEELRALYDLWVLRGEVGEREKPENSMGFVGRRYGALWLGERQHDVLVRVSGWPSRLFVSHLAQSRPRCTRVDLQATIRTGGTPDELVKRAVFAMLKARQEAVGRPWKVQLIETFGEGNTGSGGGRSSEQFVRVYNKAAQSPEQPEYAQTVRFEVECKGSLAEEVFYQLAWVNEDGKADLELLNTLLLKRGLDVIGRFNGGAEALWELPKMKTDAEKQLAWLERNVAGTVKRLVLDGFGQAVYDALGIE
jgi:hypothetical protein